MIDDTTKWRAVWATWATAFAVATTIANRTGQPHAPLCYQLRWALGVHRPYYHYRAGQVTYAVLATWLAQHLYRKTGSS